MADYWGLSEIAARLNLHPMTVSKRLNHKSFLAYKRRPPHPTSGQGQRMWYTNDSLIQLWEVMRCKQSLEERAVKRAARAKRKLEALAQANKKVDP